MKLAIMQPYFLPYIGYFQLMATSDLFVIYDDIKYTKKGWINRNRLLQNGTDSVFSIPLKKASDALDVVERELAADFDRAKLLARFAGAYKRAPQFEATFPMLQRIVEHSAGNLFSYVHHSVVAVCDHLGIDTAIRVASSLHIDKALKGQDKVLAICEAVGADRYVNPIGGTELYEREVFAARGLQLSFLRPKPIEYPQFGGAFVPWLSIVDVMMFNPIEAIREHLDHGYELV